MQEKFVNYANNVRESADKTYYEKMKNYENLDLY